MAKINVTIDNDILADSLTKISHISVIFNVKEMSGNMDDFTAHLDFVLNTGECCTIDAEFDDESETMPAILYVDSEIKARFNFHPFAMSGLNESKFWNSLKSINL
jgi:hypothetical protein